MKVRVTMFPKKNTIIVSILTVFFLPWVQQVQVLVWGDYIRENPKISILMIAFCCIIVAIIILFSFYLANYITDMIKHPLTNYDSTVNNISKINENFSYSQSPNETLFFLPLQNSNVSSLGKHGKKFPKRSQNVLYYALSAKAYFNWIDYLYFYYIREVKNLLKCKVIICLHIPDSIRLCKVDGQEESPNALNDKYEKTCTIFSEYIHKIIGSDTQIITEEYFYKKRIKDFNHFRLVHDSLILFYAKQLAENNDYHGDNAFFAREFFRNFKRRLSHINSAFSIWMIARRNKKERVFVIDNSPSLQIWLEDNFLKDIRIENEIYFIEVRNLTDANGQRIDVHDPTIVINITDTEQKIDEKLANMDTETQNIMLQMLYYTLIDKTELTECMTQELEESHTTRDNTLLLKKVLIGIKRKYNI